MTHVSTCCTIRSYRRLTVEGDPVGLSPEARLALYRTAQEALTNVRKHADASAVDIHLRYGTGGAELTVEDQGVPRPSRGQGEGYGLSDTRERAVLVKGALGYLTKDSGAQESSAAS